MSISLMLLLILVLAFLIPLMSPRYSQAFKANAPAQGMGYVSRQEFFAAGIRHIINAIFIFGLSLLIANVVYRVTPEAAFKSTQKVMLSIGSIAILLAAVWLTRGISALINGIYVKQNPISPEELMRFNKEAPSSFDGAENMTEFLKNYKANSKEDMEMLRLLADKRAQQIKTGEPVQEPASTDSGKKVVFSKTFNFTTKKKVSPEEAYRILAGQRDAERMGKDNKKVIFSKTFKIDVPIKKEEPPSDAL